ncbi:Fe-Mn family superoxide dismutase [Paenibacillus motobuensis]|uniref:superoxide dismutase n=1 Tax=Paenibacillus motobuensis TaxID=295324 RepID=A0ABN0XUM7_9BACL
MLFVYGPYLPVRILEEIYCWKRQEARHTQLIKAAIPRLEPEYVKLLDEWNRVFRGTEEEASRLLHHALSNTNAASDPHFMKEVEKLLDVSCRQSNEFIRQLHYILDHSAAVQSNPHAQALLRHVIQESEHYLLKAQSINAPHHPAHMMYNKSPNDPYSTAEYMAGPRPEIHPNEENLQADISISPENNPNFDDKENNDVTASVSEAAVSSDIRKEQSGGNLVNSANPIYSPNQAHPTNPADPPSDRDHPVPIGKHTLPPLPYAYNALEPYIDEKTMRIHHDIHHKSYVDGLNTAEKKLQDARKSGNFDLVKHWERELAFNGAGHYLHTIFWDIMNPKGGGRPEGELLEYIKRDFGSYDAFKNHFSKAAEKVEGGGWAILVWSPRSHRLEILTAEKHQNLSQWDIIPLLPLDVWEHAYYLKHQNERGKYIEDWWNVVYWPAVAKRFEQAKKLKWQPF